MIERICTAKKKNIYKTQVRLRITQCLLTTYDMHYQFFPSRNRDNIEKKYDKMLLEMQASRYRLKGTKHLKK